VLFLEPELVSEEPKKPFVNKWNPYERKEITRAQIVKLLSQDEEREWSVTEVANEIDANFQSVHIILLELVIEDKVTVRVPAEYRRVFKLNIDTVKKEWVEKEIGTTLFEE
jgi:predicted transcriptional regulator